MRIFSVLLLCPVLCGVPAPGQNSTAGPPDQPIRVDPQVVHPPVAISFGFPEIPYAARLTGTSGSCVVSVVVDVKGNPHTPQIVSCTDPVFKQNSLDAAMQYRFKPARKIDGNEPVPVILPIEIRYFVNGGRAGQRTGEVHYSVSAPPGVTSLEPDANGVYTLSNQMQAPTIVQLKKQAFADAGLSLPPGTQCSVLLVLDAKGKPVSASPSECDRGDLAKPAIQSILKSKYKPGKLNGKAVPTRLLVHLTYEGFGPQQKVIQ